MKLTKRQVALIAELDAIDPTGDPETAHMKAETALLTAHGPEVRAAYDRLVARARWWAWA